MQIHAAAFSLLAVSFLSPLLANAQDATASSPGAVAPASASPCEARPGAPAWLPCGPDRTLSEEEVRKLILKEHESVVAKVFTTSGSSGKKFFAHFKPGGKLDAGPLGSHNVGKSWKFEGGKLCRDYYAGNDRHCGVFELSGMNLYFGDPSATTKNVVTAIEYSKP